MSELPKYLIGAILGLVLGFVLAKGTPLWVSTYEDCYKRYVLGGSSDRATSEGIAYCKGRFNRSDRPN